jgi:hypothetical protein
MPTYPAAYGLTHPLVLTVGASGVMDEWADYSSWDELVGGPATAARAA